MTIHTNIEPIKTHSLEEFNSYVKKYGCNNEIILTCSNNISQETIRHLPASRTWKRNNMMEYHYIDGEQHLRVTYALRYDKDNSNHVPNDIVVKALTYFKGLLNVIPDDQHEDDIDLFVCKDHVRYSQYYNFCNSRMTDMIIDHCYSLDRNSAFAASLAKVYPQTAAWIEHYWEDRCRNGKNNPYLKLYPSIVIGYMKAHGRSHAWKKIIDDANREIHMLRERIEANGNIILLINTDSIKYIGNFPHESSNELGGYKFEWENCKMYIKSVKSYAYLDNSSNRWIFKQSGKCNLDKIKPRELWTLDEFISSEASETLKIIYKSTGELSESYEEDIF